MEENFQNLFNLLCLCSILPKVRKLFQIQISLKTISYSSAGGSQSFQYAQIFKWPNLRKKALICYWLWFSTGLIYYGLTLNSNTLGTELFTTFSIGKVKHFGLLFNLTIYKQFQLLEFPTITLVIFLLLKSGRRITLIMFYW